MAAIGYIQKVLMPLVIVLVMVAILAFLLMDASGPGGGGPFGGGQQIDKFATIDGEEVTRASYDAEFQTTFFKDLTFQGKVVEWQNRQYAPDEQKQFQLKEQAWNTYLQDNIMGKRLASAGLSVSEKEYTDLVFGPEPHQYIQALYPSFIGTPSYDPNNPAAMQNFVNTVSSQETQQQNPQAMQAYFEFTAREIEMRRQVKFDKYTQLLQKSNYIPTWMAEQDHNRTSGKRSVSFVKLPYAEIPDADITITETELENEYRAKLNTFAPKEDKRSVEYVSFPIIPTVSDTAAILQKNSDKLAEWKASSSDSAFLSLHSEGQERFNRFFRTQTDLYNLLVDSTLAEQIFNMEVGSYVGPFYEPGVYKSIKLNNRQTYPDSSNLRMIMVVNNTDESGLEEFNALDTANALLSRLAAGEDFTALAAQYSADQSRDRGGDLGWAGPNAGYPDMIKDFYLGMPELNTPQLIEADFGYLILEVIDRKNTMEYVNILQLNKFIVPSVSTVDSVNAEANDFYTNYTANQETFDKGISELGMNKRTSPFFGQNDFAVPGLQKSRDIITWAYTTEDEFDFYDKDDQLVIVRVKEIQEAGPPSMESVRTQLESDLLRKKKGAILLDKVKTASSGNADLGALAAALGAEVVTSANVSLGSSNDPTIGPEPQVIGASFGLGMNELSAPIEGVTGIFIVSPNSETAATPLDSYETNALRLNSQLANKLNLGSIIDQTKKSMEIVDNRFRFN